MGNLRYKVDSVSLFLEGKFKKKIVLPCRFCFVLFCICGQFPSISPRGLHSEGQFAGGSFALRVWGAHIWRGIFSEILRY